MAFSSCISLPFSSSSSASSLSLLKRNESLVTGFSSELCVASSRFGFRNHWSFIGGSRVALLPNVASNSSVFPRKLSGCVQASWFTTSQIASSMFTMGTIAVLPFYTLMVFAPKAKLTKKCMESSLPYVVLGVLYGYLLYLSWTPDTLKYMFSNKYFMPELSGIAKMFSSEMTLTSAWIHILLVDLFAARQVFNDGLENQIETRHSVSLCLLFCPFGIVSHVLTKALTNNSCK